MKYSLIGPLFSVPLARTDIFFQSNFWLLRYNFLLLCVTTYLLFRLLYSEKEKQFLFVFLIILFFASMFPGHVIHYYGEVFSSLLMMLGIALAERKHIIAGWALMILSVGNTPVTIFPLGLICLYKIITEKRFSYIVLFLLAAMTLIVESKIRMPRTSLGFTNYLFDDKGFTTILPYSGQAGFSYPIVFGLLGELFSFGKGLLFFAPGLLFITVVWRKLADRSFRNIFLLWLIYLLGLVLVYSKWWAWYGGWFWGPRFLLFASIPASFSLAFVLTHERSKKMRGIALLVALWSFWVGINGVVFGQMGLNRCTADNYALEHLCWYVPEFSVLLHPFIVRPSVNVVGWIMIVCSLLFWLYIALISYLKQKKH